MPTLLGIANVEPPKDRKRLRPLLLEHKPAAPRQLFWNGLAMRDDSWKLMVGSQGRAQLFNLATDIPEARDVSAQNPDRVKSMVDALEAWKKDVAAGATPQPTMLETDR